MIYRVKKTAREGKRTIHEIEGRAAARWLDLSSVGQARVGERMGHGYLPLTRPGTEGFIRRSETVDSKYFMRKVS